MRLLLVEDKDTFRRLLIQALGGTTWDVLAVGDPQEALRAVERAPFDVLVTDLRLPGMSGLELLKRVKRIHPSTRIVLMSAFGEPKDIVEAMRCGADEFLPKPFDLDLFTGTLDRLMALVEAPPPDPREPWITHSAGMRALDESLSRAADSRASVLLCGERGVGKARTARRLHSLGNVQGPFLSTVAASFSADRHLRLLAGGSVYLTDLEDLSADKVKELLAAMECEAGLRVRWMGGAHGVSTVPEPLRLRLGVLCFELPPLRERKEDILPLFRSLLEQAARREGRLAPLVERAAERDLLQRSWPGNIRELSWCAIQALRATSGPILGPLPAPGTGDETLCIPLPPPGPLEGMLLDLAKSAEPMLLRRAFESSGRDMTATAATLGLTPRTLAQRLRDCRIPLEEA
jgi:DNA-binding NtrC family response regulator